MIELRLCRRMVVMTSTTKYLLPTDDWWHHTYTYTYIYLLVAR